MSNKLIFIGLGLYDEKDISIKALEEIKKYNKIFAEFYTSKLVGTNFKKIEKIIGKKVEILSREETEKGDKILKAAKTQNVSFLTAGDPMTATTHVDLRIRAIKNGIKTKVIHGSSIVTAVPGLLGLQSYKFGRITTLAYPERDYFPTSPYDIIFDNKKMGLHTLVLLDIQEDKKRYMTANEGLKIILDMEEKIGKKMFNSDSVVCVVARAGSENPLVKAGTFKTLLDFNFGPPLHSIVIPSRLHFMEIEALMALAQLPAHLGEKLQKI